VPKTLHVELDAVIHLWVDFDPDAPDDTSIVGGQLRGVPLGVEALTAIAVAYESDILEEARLEAAHREHPSLPLDAS
jgi:hypothetical protein